MVAPARIGALKGVPLYWFQQFLPTKSNLSAIVLEIVKSKLDYVTKRQGQVR